MSFSNVIFGKLDFLCSSAVKATITVQAGGYRAKVGAHPGLCVWPV